MNEIIVDTSVWIDFFRGKEIPFLEEALKEGRVILSPVIVAELISSAWDSNARAPHILQVQMLTITFAHS